MEDPDECPKPTTLEQKKFSLTFADQVPNFDKNNNGGILQGSKSSMKKPDLQSSTDET